MKSARLINDEHVRLTCVQSQMVIYVCEKSRNFVLQIKPYLK